jgi:hypothetical protein
MTLPFVMPSSDVFFASPKRVLAHYVELFEIQIDNVVASADYYETQWLQPSGEGNKYLAQGGFVRERPEAINPLQGTNFKLLNKQKDVSDAIARGVTGFNYDIQVMSDVLNPTGKFATMLNAAQAVDPRFWIVPMFDMSALAGMTQAQAVGIIANYADKTKWPSVARWWDGRLLFSAFNATQPLAYWQGIINALNQQGINVAFIPVLLGNPGTIGPLSPISLGLAGWGTARPDTALAGPANFMNPVLAQQFRPSQSVFWEASCSQTLRNSFLTSINGGSQLIQLVTWNDYSEASQFRPYTDSSLVPGIGSWAYDLVGYYATYFATGQAPAITKDVLYPIYKKMRSTDPHPNQSKPCVIQPGQPPEESNIELLAFLTAPGTLMINGQVSSAPAGITSYKQPMAPGIPKFALQRNGSNVFSFNGPVTIGPNAQLTTDLGYYGAGFSAP